MGTRRCDCASTSGISHKGWTLTKVFRCIEHGYICPFDNWQFKDAEDLREHILKGEDQTLKCDGLSQFGRNCILETIYELDVLIDKNNKERMPLS